MLVLTRASALYADIDGACFTFLFCPFHHKIKIMIASSVNPIKITTTAIPAYIIGKVSLSSDAEPSAGTASESVSLQ